MAARVAALGLPDVEVVAHEEPLALLDHVAQHDEVVVVDAAAPRDDPGRVDIWVVAAGSDSLPRPPVTLGSHGLGVADAVELCRALGQLPERLTIVGIEAASFVPGAPLSGSVSARLDAAVRVVVDVLTSAGAPATRAAT